MCSSKSSVIEEEETGDHCDLLCGITSSVEVRCMVNFEIDPTWGTFSLFRDIWINEQIAEKWGGWTMPSRRIISSGLNACKCAQRLCCYNTVYTDLSNLLCILGCSQCYGRMLKWLHLLQMECLMVSQWDALRFKIGWFVVAQLLCGVQFWHRRRIALLYMHKSYTKQEYRGFHN